MKVPLVLLVVGICAVCQGDLMSEIGNMVNSTLGDIMPGQCVTNLTECLNSSLTNYQSTTVQNRGLIRVLSEVISCLFSTLHCLFFDFRSLLLPIFDMTEILP
ncbi:uncharacterized protein LOC130904070 [Diorhabda carinulata]|uniref:uncharacterized protein LOC130904070 n=1 Tax=Diorhabda carinulata TaxID=1163345 RepID=UPI0025A23E79|nr:uncharacterized protein LOC130904070 [Diorhabda carinulata]